VHVVYDGVGKDTFEEDFEVVRSKGTIVTFGNASVSGVPGLGEVLLCRSVGWRVVSCMEARYNDGSVSVQADRRG
jgi:NADPH:quinone reductase-like Zn-dependent oxidoreductase